MLYGLCAAGNTAEESQPVFHYKKVGLPNKTLTDRVFSLLDRFSLVSLERNQQVP
jgi:hypothetical protein